MLSEGQIESRWREDPEQEEGEEKQNWKASLDSPQEEISERVGRDGGECCKLGDAIDGSPADRQCVEGPSGSHDL